ncbi:MAG: ABC transporter permease [Deltaproteobacteria bacterium]|jgi:ABC-2 type transport system permease protein|nr:ABC transporter permease [Deltaproteobacteria bacterium]
MSAPIINPRRIRLLAWAEFRAFWTNPSGGLALLVFLGIAGVLFYNAVADHATANLGALARGRLLSADLSIFSNGLTNLGLVILLVSPLTTMRSMSPYAQGGHLDLLLAWPLSPWELILGQYLAAVMTLGLLTSLSLLPFLVIWFMGVGSLAVLLSSALGLALLISAFSALGLAIATLTSSPLAAALTSLGVLAFLWSLGWAAPYLPPWAAYLAQGLAIAPRLSHFALGLIDLNDALFFLALTLVSLWIGRPRADRG